VGGAFALYTYLQGIEDRRAKYSQELIERWNRAEMLPFRATLRALTEKRLNPADLARTLGQQLPPDIDGTRANIVTILNFFEEVAIAARTNSANEMRLYEFFDSIVRQTYSHLEDWVRAERKIDNEVHYYSELEALYGKWTKRSSTR